jgi:hypothetical protein
MVAYSPQANNYAVWTHEVGGQRTSSLDGTQGASYPFWSPDGRFIGFFADGKLKKVEVSGGQPQVQPFAEFGAHPIGYLMYDTTAHMCVTLANPSPPRWADPAKPSDSERALTHKSMEAYCRTYEVREKKGQVIHRPELAEWPHYIGSNQVRNF